MAIVMCFNLESLSSFLISKGCCQQAQTILPPYAIGQTHNQSGQLHVWWSAEWRHNLVQEKKKWWPVNNRSEITAKQHTKMCLCKCLRWEIGYAVTQSSSIFVQHCLVLQIDLSSLSLMSSGDRSLLLSIHSKNRNTLFKKNAHLPQTCIK